MTTPKYDEYVVRKDSETGNGVIYVDPELIGYAVLLVPLHLIDQKWVREARGEPC